VLCSHDKTFHLRQVQTSNSLFVTQPQLLPAAHGNTSATVAIAACTTTLELHPSLADPATLLRDLLPLYDLVAGHVDATPNVRSRATIFDHLPLSHAQCLAGWIELMAFEHDGSTYCPTPSALTHVWRSINAAALADGIKLDAAFQTEEIAKAVADEGHPPDLARAVLTHLSGDEQVGWSRLDRPRTVALVGATMLEAQGTSTTFLISDFTDTWEDSLPEAWRKDAQLGAIDGLYECPSTTTIRIKSKLPVPSVVDDTTTATKSSARKWHEKFANSRKK
jgi:sister chromatid cohesion protein DCC1